MIFFAMDVNESKNYFGFKKLKNADFQNIFALHLIKQKSLFKFKMQGSSGQYPV